MRNLLTGRPVASPVQGMSLIIFSLGEGGGYFWEVLVGMHRRPHLIFPLFQSNIYTVNVREFLPGIKGTKKGRKKGFTFYYESVYFKELHNEQEYYWPTIYRAGAAVVSTIASYLSGAPNENIVQNYLNIA